MDRAHVLIERIVDAEIARRRCDVRIEAGRIVAIERSETGDGEAGRDEGTTLDARGGALLPGLHDHHLHLFALAAALDGVECGPPTTQDASALERALADAPARDGWIRGTRYHETVAGPLDRARIDAWRDDVPVRIQHRSGVMWFLNSRAIEALALDASEPPSPPAPTAIERDADGRATGRLFRADAWLRARLSRDAPPALDAVGALLARRGVTRVTDCSPDNDDHTVALLREAQRSGALPQRITLMGSLALGRDSDTPGSTRGTREITLDGRDIALDAHKIMLDEPALPELGALIARITAAHEDGRAVAFHAVTRAELVFALAAIEAAGPHAGDRVEHASVAPPELVDRVADLGLTVVTQPNFVAERGDDYLRDVDGRDQPHLYRLQSWRNRGVRLAGGTDAPYGAPDPWAAMQAATTRATRSEAVLGAHEELSPEAACALFAPTLARTIDYDAKRPPSPRVGDPADLCLLGVPWAEARRQLEAAPVRATLIGGRTVHLTDP